MANVVRNFKNNLHMKKTVLSICILMMGILVLAQTPEQWRIVNGSIYSVAYAPTNPNMILVSTQDGVIRKSTDGGVSWKEKNLGSKSGVTSLKAFSNTHFIGVNSNSEVVLSSDAGETWSVNILKDSLGNKIFSLTEIVILSETEAFVKTVEANAKTFYTTDNGLSWSYYKYKQPKSLFQVNDTLIGLDHLPVPPYGFTKALAILRSTNMGKTYDTIAFPPAGLAGNNFNNVNKKGYENISFINAQNFFINVNDRIFYKTTNGGLNFTGIDFPGSKSIYDLFFITPEVGIVSAGRTTVEITKDGGNTWKTLQNKDEFLGPTIIKHLHEVNGKFFMMDYYNSYILDESLVVSTPQNFAPTNLQKASLVNDTILLAPYGNYFYKSINGGLTWGKTNPILGQFNDNANYDSYAVRGKDSIFVIANTRLYLSKDGGQTFSLTHTFPEFNPQYYYFKYLGGDNFILVGNGALRYSIDGGVNWTSKATGVTTPLAISAVSIDAIYILGNYKVQFSGDTGTSFVNVTGNLPANRDYGTKLFFVNKNLGFLYGGNGFLYRTADGGTSWTNQSTAIPSIRMQHWDMLAAKNENEIFIMDADGRGSNEKVFHSLDGGLTWDHDANNLGLYDPTFMTFKSGAQGLATGPTLVYRSGLYEATVNEIDVDETITGTYTYSFDEERVSFYPNPCSNQLNLQSAEDIVKLELLTANGVIVFTKNNDTNQLMLDDYSGGVYFIKVYTSRDVQTIRIVKK